jgi:hypothetical protein
VETLEEVEALVEAETLVEAEALAEVEALVDIVQACLFPIAKAMTLPIPQSVSPA